MSRKRKLEKLDDERLGNRFGQRVREVRIEAGLTQKELAERVGVPAQYVSMVETGSSANPTLRLIVLLADALDVPTSDLLVDVERPGAQPKSGTLEALLREAPASARALAIRLLETWPKAS